jgi:hypothetical protein
MQGFAFPTTRLPCDEYVFTTVNGLQNLPLFHSQLFHKFINNA